MVLFCVYMERGTLNRLLIDHSSIEPKASDHLISRTIQATPTNEPDNCFRCRRNALCKRGSSLSIRGAGIGIGIIRGEALAERGICNKLFPAGECMT